MRHCTPFVKTPTWNVNRGTSIIRETQLHTHQLKENLIMFFFFVLHVKRCLEKDQLQNSNPHYNIKSNEVPWAFTWKHDIFTCEKKMLYLHVKRSLFLWLNIIRDKKFFFLHWKIFQLFILQHLRRKHSPFIIQDRWEEKTTTRNYQLKVKFSSQYTHSLIFCNVAVSKEPDR